MGLDTIPLAPTADEVTITNATGQLAVKDGGITRAKIDPTAVFPYLFQVYTGSGFNSSHSGSGSTEGSFELDAIDSATLSPFSYVKFKETGTAYIQRSGTSVNGVEFKIQTKPIGGAYSDSLAYKKLVELDSDGLTSVGITASTYTIEWLHSITAQERLDGLQPKIFSKSVSGGNTISFTNIQTVVELV